MKETDAGFDRSLMPRLASVKAAGELCVKVRWAEGSRKGSSETVDLAPLVEQFKFYAPLRKNRKLFGSVSLEDDGEVIVWGDGEIDMPATSIERLANEQMTGDDFCQFLKRNNLTRSAAAAELGRSLRAIQSYTASKEPIPRIVALACRGYEAKKQKEPVSDFPDVQDTYKVPSDQIRYGYQHDFISD